jgi:hypothetical protein
MKGDHPPTLDGRGDGLNVSSQNGFIHMLSAYISIRLKMQRQRLKKEKIACLLVINQRPMFLQPAYLRVIMEHGRWYGIC